MSEQRSERDKHDKKDILEIHEAALRESSLPEEGNERGPWWLYTVIVGTLAFGFFYMGFYLGEFSDRTHVLYESETAQVSEVEPELTKAELGQQTYTNVCQNCHQADGAGIPGVYPTLHGAPLAINEKEKLIGLILHGLEGELLRENGTYNAIMPAWQDRLNDKEVAAVATYIRTQFGNAAGEVIAEDVTPVRERERTQSWTETELNEEFGN